MTENTNIIDEKNINPGRSLDLYYWCDELNVRAEELKDIIKQVGPSLHEIRLYLSKKLLLSWPAAY